ncbi:uncharacterized protein LOC127100312 [Lathyrus oleraceus]|uniref:uncharacterized protein LOC127100312 n=1 Tax=Pisum sativum TaxID=3888 RepID=UPI0021CE00B0|nr:uncharacterized protein LOC127100312 [Pisum sativum]
MTPNRTQLQSMAQKDNESFKEYAQCWRELAARVHPSLVDRELIDIFMDTLQGKYYERLISSVCTGFSDMVIMGERVEEGLKSEGHTIENCKVFKLRVQELIDQKILSFADVPNVGNNPLPKHDGSGVNVIESSTGDGLIKDVFKLKTLLTVVHARLMEAELMKGVHDNCVRKDDEDVVVIVPVFDQERLPKPFMVSYKRNVDLDPVKKIEPMVIYVPAPFSFDSTKAVPWNYEPVVYVGNKPVILKEPDVTNIAGASGVTRSGRVFAPEVIPSQASAPTVEPTKGKEVSPLEIGEGSKKAVTTEEDRELLKIIKKSDYKFLNEAYVEEDINVIQFDDVVANLNASSCLMFTDDDLPPNGREHNMALHISIKCTDVTLAPVLVDTGSSLNMLPKTTLAQLNIKGAQMRPNALIVKAFDGSKQTVIGEIDLPILIGPQTFRINFQVMDIRPAYSCMLGRHWIHATGVITSTLHQKLKFVTSGKLALEVVNVVQTKSKPVEEPKRVMSSQKSVKAAIEVGCPGSWGTMIELPEKKDKCGLGYQPSIELFKDQKIHRGKVPSIQEIISKGGFQSEDQVNALEDEDPYFSKMVFCGPPNAALTNWKATDVSEIVSCSK